MSSEYIQEINRRRTFAIISHPDAGKTTLTEKFLLYGGAINLAGSVKGKATARHAVSDWMEIEKERGISVTSSVLQFEYDGYCINIRSTGPLAVAKGSKGYLTGRRIASSPMRIPRREQRKVRQRKSRWRRKRRCSPLSGRSRLTI